MVRHRRHRAPVACPVRRLEGGGDLCRGRRRVGPERQRSHDLKPLPDIPQVSERLHLHLGRRDADLSQQRGRAVPHSGVDGVQSLPLQLVKAAYSRWVFELCCSHDAVRRRARNPTAGPTSV